MNIEQVKTELLIGGFFENWISADQRNALRVVLDGEEGQFFADLLADLKDRIQNMPATYDTDGQGDEATVYLHYFRGSIDAWITEKDRGGGHMDGDKQHQAFGKITLTGSRQDAELGYISIHELIQNGVELDLYWVPKPLSAI